MGANLKKLIKPSSAKKTSAINSDKINAIKSSKSTLNVRILTKEEVEMGRSKAYAYLA